MAATRARSRELRDAHDPAGAFTQLRLIELAAPHEARRPSVRALTARVAGHRPGRLAWPSTPAVPPPCCRPADLPVRALRSAPRRQFTATPVCCWASAAALVSLHPSAARARALRPERPAATPSPVTAAPCTAPSSDPQPAAPGPESLRQYCPPQPAGAAACGEREQLPMTSKAAHARGDRPNTKPGPARGTPRCLMRSRSLRDLERVHVGGSVA